MNSYIFLFTVLAVVALVIGIAIFTKFTLDSTQYDRLKWIVVRWSYLVGFISLFVDLFNVPYGFETVELVAGLGAVLAGLLGVSNTNFKRNTEQTAFNEDDFAAMMEGNWDEAENDATEE